MSTRVSVPVDELRLYPGDSVTVWLQDNISSVGAAKVLIYVDADRNFSAVVDENIHLCIRKIFKHQPPLNTRG